MLPPPKNEAFRQGGRFVVVGFLAAGVCWHKWFFLPLLKQKWIVSVISWHREFFHFCLALPQKWGILPKRDRFVVVCFLPAGICWRKLLYDIHDSSYFCDKTKMSACLCPPLPIILATRRSSTAVSQGIAFSASSLGQQTLSHIMKTQRQRLVNNFPSVDCSNTLKVVRDEPRI